MHVILVKTHFFVTYLIGFLFAGVLLPVNAWANSSAWVKITNSETPFDITIIDHETQTIIYECGARKQCRKKLKDIELFDVQASLDGETYTFQKIPLAGMSEIFGLYIVSKEDNQKANLQESAEENWPQFPAIMGTPKMPKEAETSGFCNANLKLSERGLPTFIEITGCTHQYLAEPSYYSIAMTRYHIPENAAGEVKDRVFTIKRTYILTDSRGNIIQ